LKELILRNLWKQLGSQEAWNFGWEDKIVRFILGYLTSISLFLRRELFSI